MATRDWFMGSKVGCYQGAEDEGHDYPVTSPPGEAGGGDDAETGEDEHDEGCFKDNTHPEEEHCHQVYVAADSDRRLCDFAAKVNEES